MRRANSVVRKAGRTRVAFHAEGARELAGALLGGSEAAIAWARAGREEPQLLSENWAEGGVFVDVEGRRVAFWSEVVPVAWRWALCGMVREAWSGWSVEWAGRGAVGIARAAGIGEEGLEGDAGDVERLEAFRGVGVTRGKREGWRTGAIIIGGGGVERFVVWGMSALHLGALGERVVVEVKDAAEVEGEVVVRGEVEVEEGRHEVAGIARSTGPWDGGTLLVDVKGKVVVAAPGDALARDERVERWLARVWAGWRVVVHGLGEPGSRAIAGLPEWASEDERREVEARVRAWVAAGS